MPRLVLPAIVALAVLSFRASSAEACGDSGCHSLVASALAVENTLEVDAPRDTPTVAPAAAEEEVRAHDLAKREAPVPAFWMQFKSYAYKQLPTHQEKSFTAVWIAMPVETPDETVAGVGLQGIWW